MSRIKTLSGGSGGGELIRSRAQYRQDGTTYRDRDCTEYFGNEPYTELFFSNSDIICVGEDVTELTLSHLSGQIPPEIGELINLTYLKIWYSWSLGGVIPPEIGNLTNLTFLAIYQTAIGGLIPPEIGNLVNLTVLGFYWNWGGLNGPIPPEIGNLTNLHNIALVQNNLESIPPEMWELPNLSYINIGDNALVGEIPPTVGNLTNLTHLKLDENALSGPIPSEIGNLTNLTTLNLARNDLTGEIPFEIGTMTNLNYLKLNDNQLSGEIPENICDLDFYWVYDEYWDWNDNAAWYNVDFFDIGGNQLCPPWPQCVEAPPPPWQDWWDGWWNPRLNNQSIQNCPFEYMSPSLDPTPYGYWEYCASEGNQCIIGFGESTVAYGTHLCFDTGVGRFQAQSVSAGGGTWIWCDADSLSMGMGPCPQTWNGEDQYPYFVYPMKYYCYVWVEEDPPPPRKQLPR